MNMHTNLADIRRVADVIREMLGDDFDDQTFLDTLDGETDAMDFAGFLITSRVEAASLEAAAKDVAATFTARARRMKAKQDACAKGLGELLDAMGQSKLAHPLATVSRTKPRVSLSITDDKEVPTQLCKLTPDNAAIKAALEAGEAVPGATLTTGDAGVVVRVK